MHGSRDISLVPSLHSASTDALMNFPQLCVYLDSVGIYRVFNTLPLCKQEPFFFATITPTHHMSKLRYSIIGKWILGTLKCVLYRESFSTVSSIRVSTV